jgi:hypothetical protein
VVNAFHLTFSRLAINRIISGGMPSPASLGVNMYNATPNFTDLSLTNYFSVGGGSNAPAFFIRNQWQVADEGIGRAAATISAWAWRRSRFR